MVGQTNRRIRESGRCQEGEENLSERRTDMASATGGVTARNKLRNYHKRKKNDVSKDAVDNSISLAATAISSVEAFS